MYDIKYRDSSDTTDFVLTEHKFILQAQETNLENLWLEESF
jgi:hypothetical protein